MTEQAAGVVSLLVRAIDPSRGPSLDEGRLAHLEKLATIGQTAAEIVHELNNPLTAILAYSEYLGKRLGERGVADADVDRVLRIHEAASRIQHFCRDLTDYSRPASALRTAVDLHAVIDRASASACTSAWRQHRRAHLPRRPRVSCESDQQRIPRHERHGGR